MPQTPVPARPHPALWGLVALSVLLHGGLLLWGARAPEAQTPAAVARPAAGPSPAARLYQALERAQEGRLATGAEPSSDDPLFHEVERLLAARGYVLEDASHWALNAGGEYHTFSYARQVAPGAPREHWTLTAVVQGVTLTELGWVFDRPGGEKTSAAQGARAWQFDSWNQAQVEEELLKRTALTLLPRLNAGLVYGAAVDAVQRPCPDPVADLEFSEVVDGWVVQACHTGAELHVWLSRPPLG